MGILSIDWLAKLETNMRHLVTEGAEDVLDEMWWTSFAKVIPSQSETEHFNWFVSNALIEDAGMGGNIRFREMVMAQTSFTNKYANSGLRVQRAQFLDLDGNGIRSAAQWATEIGVESQYWPQRSIAATLLAGAASTCYDSKNFFATDHPVNPKIPSYGTFANLFTSTASGAYPGACPIDESVSAEVALQNMGKIWKYLAGIKSSNGSAPRNIRPWKILVPPALVPRATQLSDAKFIAQVAESGASAGSGDVSALIQRLGFGRPVMAPEISAAFGGSDTTWFVLAKQAERSQIGALTYVEREPFAVRYYTGEGGGTGVDANLDRMQEYEWHVQGRNVSGYGHPYLLFRVNAT